MTHGDAAATAAITPAANDRLDVRRDVENHHHAEEQNRLEHFLDTDDDEDRADDEGGKHLGNTCQPILEHERDQRW